VLAANGSLYRGLWYSSLQELSALCFVGLGLLARRRTWPRLLGFLVAAWFKSPFAWLLIGYGVVLLLRRASRWWGALSLALGVGTLVAAAEFARSGSYTAALSFGPDHLWQNGKTAAVALVPAIGVLLVGMLAFRIRPRWAPRALLAEDAGSDRLIGPALLLGGAGYLVNLLPWQTGAHYAAAYVYLLGAGAVLTLAGSARWPAAGERVTGPGGRRIAAGLLAVAVAIGLAVLASGGRYVWQNAQTTVGLRDCVLGLPDGSLVGYNRPEAWDRLNSIVHEHRPGSKSRVVLFRDGSSVGVNNTQTFTHADYYIWEPGYGTGTPALRSGPVVCRTSLATVYRVG
jgi:hypothetical protein